MRAIVMVLLVVAAAGRCFAEDPLETLNTVDDTVSIMEHTLKERGHQLRAGKLTSGAGSRADTCDLTRGSGVSETDRGSAAAPAPSEAPLKNSPTGEE